MPAPELECPKCGCNDVSPVRGKRWPWWDVPEPGATEPQPDRQQAYKCGFCGKIFWAPAPTTAPPLDHQQLPPLSLR